MKTPLLSVFTAIAVQFLGSSIQLLAQDGPVTTGIIQEFSKENGTLTLRSEQSGVGTVTYHGMDKANVMTVAGKLGTAKDLASGMRVSVFYAKQGDRVVVSKVLIPDPAPVSLNPATPPVVSRAAVDGDRTTQPGKNENKTDIDRTKRPENNAAVDGDRTTVPAQDARTNSPRTGGGNRSAGGGQ